MLMMACLLLSCHQETGKIDRYQVVNRHNVELTAVDSLASLSVGNGNIAFTVDVTGLQSFPERYRLGVPLGSQSQWGWHSFPNVENYRIEESFKVYDFRGKEELYAVQFNEKGRPQAAANYFRANPHRLHLGYVGMALYDADGKRLSVDDLTNIHQQLDLWNGQINSRFEAAGKTVRTTTFCHPSQDKLVAKVSSDLFSKGQLAITWRFPYPSGAHSDDASDWTKPSRHQTIIVEQQPNAVVLQRVLDATTYYVTLTWQGNAAFKPTEQAHTFCLTTTDSTLVFASHFTEQRPAITSLLFDNECAQSAQHWNDFWSHGGIVDFSQCTDPRATELERRVLLSQYLTAIQCSGIYPPQETGLTYNSWFGKYHLEMHWWHGVHFALWGRPELMQPALEWYQQAAPNARSIAQRQGFKGLRWMKMTDPSAIEAPSKVGSFLIWQQPHYLYMAELVYRNNPKDSAAWMPYKDLVFATADFMADFVDYDGLEDRYVLKGAIPAQETLRASETVNAPFELSYWHYALSVAQQWRLRLGMPKNMEWEIILDKLSPLAYNDDKLYLAAETATDTYLDTRYTSDHMAVLGALGILPESRLVRKDIMTNTFHWIWDNWNWGKTWGWDYPMTAMCAARLGLPEQAVDALLMDKRTNTYLPNGHNYQDGRLRIYLPGNGGLLTAVAMMCAGWDGSQVDCPGFPKDGRWNVRWEGLQPMP